MPVGIIVRVLAYGVPALLIILGWISVTGGKIMEAVTGDPDVMFILGICMIIFGVLIYIVELLFGIH